MYAYGILTVDGFNDTVIVVLAANKIHIVDIEQKDAHLFLLLTKKLHIALLNLVEILIGYVLLIAPATLPDVLLKMLYVAIEINQQIGFGHG